MSAVPTNNPPNAPSRARTILRAIALFLVLPVGGFVFFFDTGNDDWRLGIAVRLVSSVVFCIPPIFGRRLLRSWFRPSEKLFDRFLITAFCLMVCDACIIVAVCIVGIPSWLIYVVSPMFTVGCAYLLMLSMIHDALPHPKVAPKPQR